MNSILSFTFIEDYTPTLPKIEEKVHEKIELKQSIPYPNLSLFLSTIEEIEKTDLNLKPNTLYSNDNDSYLSRATLRTI